MYHLYHMYHVLFPRTLQMKKCPLGILVTDHVSLQFDGDYNVAKFYFILTSDFCETSADESGCHQPQ